MSISENVSRAINDFDVLLASLKEKDKSKVGGSFRARCREIPSLIEDVGFIPALSFCYAKAKKEIYDEIKEKLNQRIEIDEKDFMEKSYGIYLYLTLKRLSELKLIDKTHVNDPIQAFEELSQGKERVASMLIKPYLVQLKKLAEAVFKAEG